MLFLRRQFGLGILSGLFVLLSGTPPAARADAPPQGLFLNVPTSITSGAAHQLKEATSLAKRRFDQGRENRAEAGGGKFIVVYDFNPGNRPSSSTDYGACRDLADALRDLHDVHTVAFVHNEVTGHSVLPVLACKELVMSAEGKLGDVRRGQTQPLKADQEKFYEYVISNRPHLAALAQKMIDPDLQVVKGGQPDGGGRYYLDARLARTAKDNVVTLKDGTKVLLELADGQPVVVARAGGDSTLFTADQAQQLGLCRGRAKDQQELATLYGLPLSALRQAALGDRNPLAWRIDVNGPLEKGLAESVRGKVNRAVESGATHVILQLESSGGDWHEAEQLAHYLFNLKDPRHELPVWTIAYFPTRPDKDKPGAVKAWSAADTAALVALGCTDVVLGKEVSFGDFALWAGDAQVQQALERLLKQRLCDKNLARGMIDPNATVFLAERLQGRQERRVFTQEEWDQEVKDPEQWRRLDTLDRRGAKLLVLGGPAALDVGVAQHQVEGFDPLCSLYGLDPKRVHVAGTDWLDDLALFLIKPQVSIILIMIGITCLILEFKVPGITLPGVIAALCFVLFFWSQSHMSGSIGWLAALLFLLGLILLGVEVFLVPGFGAPGITGILLVVGSMILAIYNNQRTQSQAWGLEMTLGVFGLALVGSVVAAFVLASYLPQIPGLNRLILKPVGEGAEGPEGEPAADLVAPQLAALLGAIGVATTPLRPAGKVQFGDEFIDVLAEGGFINPGTRVQVVEIEGNRVVVKEV